MNLKFGKMKKQKNKLDNYSLNDSELDLIARRKLELRSGKVKGVSHEEVIARLRS